VLLVGPLYTNHLRRWAHHAAALGYTVHAAGHTKPGRVMTDLAGLALEVHVSPERPDRRARWLRELIEETGPDLVHAHWLPSWGYASVRARSLLGEGPPVIVTAWGSDLYLAEADARARADAAMRSADWVLALSEHMQTAMLARGVAPERVRRADLGVDLERFRPASSEEKGRLRLELGLPPGPVVLSPRAGTALYRLDVVLEAFRAVRRDLPETTLVLVHGDAAPAPRVRRLLEEVGEDAGVHVVGHVPHAEMPKYVRAATVAVSIPSSDGSPSSVWEALASGVPVVLSHLPQIAERVGQSGAVSLVQARPAALAAALVEVLSDSRKRARMEDAARSWAIGNADQREQITRLGAIYACARAGLAAGTAGAFSASA